MVVQTCFSFYKHVWHLLFALKFSFFFAFGFHIEYHFKVKRRCCRGFWSFILFGSEVLIFFWWSSFKNNRSMKNDTEVAICVLFCIVYLFA